MEKTRAFFSVLVLALTAMVATAADTHSYAGKSIQLYTTAADGNQRLAASGTARFQAGQQPLETDIAVFVNPRQRFQKILGFGGAITDASAEVFASLPAAKQAEFLTAYYDREQGIGYTMARTTIHSSDFSGASYTYVDEGDVSLQSFSIEHDRRYRIPLLKKAFERSAGNLSLFVSPWSPPAFMKSNKSMLQGGKLEAAFHDAWARYFVKFINAYQQEGIPVWGLTVQNEPMATQKWESVIYTAEEERDFLKKHLGPTLKKAGLGDKKIIVWDHNRDLLPHRASTILDDPAAAKFVWGVGYHWYETWTGGEPMHGNIAAVKAAYPDKTIFLTESAIEKFTQERYQYWPNGEKYGRNMINDLNSGSAGWVDWNILLDQHGGPNHVGNFCFAAIHADTEKGELIYTPIYYYIGHFAKFIRPNAVRIGGVSSRSVLLTTSFINEDKKIATVVMNQGDSAIQYKLLLGNAEAVIDIPAHAIQTLMY